MIFIKKTDKDFNLKIKKCTMLSVAKRSMGGVCEPLRARKAANLGAHGAHVLINATSFDLASLKTKNRASLTCAEFHIINKLPIVLTKKRIDRELKFPSILLCHASIVSIFALSLRHHRPTQLHHSLSRQRPSSDAKMIRAAVSDTRFCMCVLFLHAKLSAGGEFYDRTMRGLRFGGRALGACFERAGGGCCCKKMDDV